MVEPLEGAGVRAWRGREELLWAAQGKARTDVGSGSRRWVLVEARAPAWAGVMRGSEHRGFGDLF